jgi:hypothetical protein
VQINRTDHFQVENIEYVSDQPLHDGVAALEYATGDVTDGKYASGIASATDNVDLEEPCPMCPAWA